MIDGIFNILNFLLLIAAGYYFFKQYALGFLRRQIAFEKLSHDALRRQCDEMQKQKKNLELQGRRQQTEFQDLSGKIARWKEDVALANERAAEHQKMVEQLVHERRLQQLHDQQVYDIHARVVPQAVQEAEEKLKKIFEQDVAGRTYMQSIVQHMRTYSDESCT